MTGGDTDDGGAAAFDRIVDSIDPPMYVVTAAAGGERSGCLVGFATQASIDPPRLLVCLSKVNHTFAVAAATDLLAVHVLRRGDHHLARRFGHETGDEVDKFAGLDVTSGPGGVPVLAGLDHVVGRVLDRVDCGDHVAVLLAPEGGDASHADEPQLGLRDVTDVEPGHPA